MIPMIIPYNVTIAATWSPHGQLRSVQDPPFLIAHVVKKLSQADVSLFALFELKRILSFSDGIIG